MVAALRIAFPPPVGALGMRPESSPDLSGFAEAHLVQELRYFEPLRGGAGRGLERLLRRAPAPAFAALAEARTRPGSREPDARICVQAAGPLEAAAAVAGTLTCAALGGQLAAGLLTPREALAPQTLLTELEKRGLRVSADESE